MKYKKNIEENSRIKYTEFSIRVIQAYTLNPTRSSYKFDYPWRKAIQFNIGLIIIWTAQPD